jgi:fatty acid desaturase
MNNASQVFANDHDAEHLVDNLEYALSIADQPQTRIRRQDAPAEMTGVATIDRLLRYCLEDWGWIVLCWIGMTWSPTWMYPLWALLIGGRIHALGVILHDLTHMPIREKTLKVRITEALCGYPISSTLNAMRFHHLRHHRDSGMDTDPYFKKGVMESRWLYFLMTIRGVLLVPYWSLRGYVGLISLFVPSWRNTYAHAFLQDKTTDDMTHNRETLRCAREELGQVIVHTLVYIYAWHDFDTVLFYYFIPVTVAGILNAHRVLMEHNYVVARDRNIETIIKTTVDHNLDPLGRLFFAPRNIGFHIVHHIHPSVGLENLPALRAWYRNKYPELYPPSQGLFVAGK